MKRLFVSFGVAALIVVAGCAQEVVTISTTCTTVIGCPLDQVCDRAVGKCIPEPPDRFLGAFECVLREPGANAELNELSEIVGRVGDKRFPLPRVAFCTLDSKRDELDLGFSVEGAPLAFTVSVTASVAKRGSAEIVPYINAGPNAAEMWNRETGNRFGSSAKGQVTVSGDLAIGKTIRGYVDIAMNSVANADVLYGVPCPRGIADCGRIGVEGGGALCATINSHLVCVAAGCKADGDCVRGNGVCIAGGCTKPCTTSRDCTSPLECVADGDGPNQPTGCF